MYHMSCQCQEPLILQLYRIQVHHLHSSAALHKVTQQSMAETIKKTDLTAVFLGMMGVTRQKTRKKKRT